MFAFGPRGPAWRDAILAEIPVRLTFVCLGLALGFAPALHAAQEPAFVARYCTGCHNERVKAGSLVLEPATLVRPAEHAEVWEKVIRKLDRKSVV